MGAHRLARITDLDQIEQRQRQTNPWYRFASYGWDRVALSPADYELVRRSRLTAWFVLILMLATIAGAASAVSDTATLLATLVVAGGVLVAGICNRFGFVTSAGVLLVVIVTAALIVGVTGAPQGLDTIYLPTYDLLGATIIIGASILPRVAAFIIAAVNMALIYGDIMLQSKTGDLLVWYHREGALPIVARSLALQIVLAGAAYLWVRGMDKEIARANSAEAREQRERLHKQELERYTKEGRSFIQAILNTLSAHARGHTDRQVVVSAMNPFFDMTPWVNKTLLQVEKEAREGGVGEQAVTAVARLKERLRTIIMELSDPETRLLRTRSALIRPTDYNPLDWTLYYLAHLYERHPQIQVEAPVDASANRSPAKPHPSVPSLASMPQAPYSPIPDFASFPGPPPGTEALAGVAGGNGRYGAPAGAANGAANGHRLNQSWNASGVASQPVQPWQSPYPTHPAPSPQPSDGSPYSW